MGISYLSMIPIPAPAEILVLLIIIGLFVLAIYKARIFKAAQTPFPMSWFCFYTYFLLPFWSMCILAEFDKMGKVSILPLWFIAYTLGLIALIVAVFIGLYKRKLWGWYLNWVLLVVKTLSYPLQISVQEKNINKIVAFVIALVIFGLMYTLPNVIYFRKRKVLFT